MVFEEIKIMTMRICDQNTATVFPLFIPHWDKYFNRPLDWEINGGWGKMEHGVYLEEIW